MIKAILNQQTVNSYIDFHKRLKIPFVITLSNYTTRIESDLYNIHFLKQIQSNRVFSAFAKVKADCIKKPLPLVNMSKLQYYNTAFFNFDFYSDTIYNIDLKAAYATILYRDGYISKKTYDYLKKLPKMERLAALGMLAGKKTIYNMDANGEPIEEKPTVIISETAPYFFYCVRRTAEIMNEAAHYLGEAFLFTWVDGIYFLQNHDASKNYYEIMKKHFFAEKGFSVSFEILTEFLIEPKKEFYKCSFIKEGKKKVMTIPKPDNLIIQKITQHLLTKKYK